MPRGPRRAVLAPVLCACWLFLACCASVGAAGSTGSTPNMKAHAAASLLVGVADEHTEMFADPLWQRLHTRVTRYIVPYDAAVHPSELSRATTWIDEAEAGRQQILIAFYYSDYTPTRMPTVPQYEHDVKKFLKLFPHVHQYEPWNEANRGNVRLPKESYDSPTAADAALYYGALRFLCPACNVPALDVLDQPEVAPTLSYIGEFKAELHRLRIPTPTLWGLHNYSDTNRFSSTRTRAILAVVPGQVWLTETGGIVKFGTDFSNFGGSGVSRAAQALSYMFGLASSNSRIKRLYIYQWSGGNSSVLFDAGLTTYQHKPRPGYVVVCVHLHAAKCHVKVSLQ